MSYTKTITPSFETIGRRRRMTGVIGEVFDGDTLVHAQEYPNYSAAERATDALVYDLLSDPPAPEPNPLGDEEGDGPDARLGAIRNVAQYVRQYTTVTRHHNGRGRSRTYAADVDTIADTARQLAEMVEAMLDTKGAPR